MEHWEELRPGGLRVVWSEDLFPPGTDSFLLASLPRLRRGLRVCDLCCGTGLVSLLLLQRQGDLRVTGLDLQQKALELAERAAEANGLTDRLAFVQGDLRDRGSLPAGAFDLAVCNPPYYPADRGPLAADAARRTARAETDCTLEEVCRAAARLLRWGGRFCLVHKPERLGDLLCALRAAGLEGKRLRFACKTAASAPSLVLAEGRRGGRPGLTVEAPLILEAPGGGPSAELERIYFREEDKP